MPTKLFQKGNQFAKLKGKHGLSKALFKNDKAMLDKMMEKALAGDVKCLTWFLDRSYGKLPLNKLNLKGTESSEELLAILKASDVPLEVVTTFNRLLDSTIKVEDVAELQKQLKKIEKKMKKDSGGWK